MQPMGGMCGYLRPSNPLFSSFSRYLLNAGARMRLVTERQIIAARFGRPASVQARKIQRS